MSEQSAYEINGQSVSRQRFYAFACDPRRSVAVEACAGAGKTWMLVSRMVRALLQGGAPHEILAITFTRKAAGEMRERLHDWLVMFAKATPEQLRQELIARGIGPQPTPDQCLALQNLYQRGLQSGRPVQIRTFHSWFAALLRSAPLAVLQALGLPASYELLEDDAVAVAQVWRRFQRSLVAQPQALQDYRELVAEHGRFQAGRALAAALAKRVEFELADAHEVVDGSVRAFAQQFGAFQGLAQPFDLLWHEAQYPRLHDAAAALSRASQPSFSAKGAELALALAAADAPAVLAALLTQTGSARKFSDKLAGIESVRAVQELALLVQAALAQHRAWLHQQRMARLTRVLLAEYAALKRERGWIDMADVERAALVLLSDPVLAGWVQERLDARVAHLMIDEFQDTSPLQWQALSAWLSAYAGAGQAPSVFLVGDPKQSIYRFRRAEPQVFRAAQRFVLEGLGGDLLSCDHTRRNAVAVVSLVNRVMGEAQQAGQFEAYRAHTTESGQAGAVWRLPYIERATLVDQNAGVPRQHWRDTLSQPRCQVEDSIKALECRQAAQWLAQRLVQTGFADFTQTGDGERLRAGQVMVLSRRRERLGLMQEALRALQVPTQQPEKTDLIDAPEVQDLVAVVDVLLSPDHDLSLARALKSPLFGLTDADLTALALQVRAARASGTPAVSWLDVLLGPVALSPDLSAAAPTLRRWRAWLADRPVHDALHAIYDDADVLARFGACAPLALRASVLANLRALLGATLQVGGGRFVTPYAWVRALKAGGVKAAVAAPGDAVRLLTIHGAKGLEARLVLLLDTDSESPRSDTMGVQVEWPGEAAMPHRLVFLASQSQPPTCMVEALAREQAAQQREELNALYVAMTRARTELVLSGVEPHRAQRQSWWSRLHGNATPLVLARPGRSSASERQAPVAGVPDASISGHFTLPFLPLAQMLPAQPAIKTIANSGPTPDSRTSRIGQALHRLLERHGLGVRALEGWPLQTVAQEFELDDAGIGQALAMARCIVQGQGAWAWDAALLSWQGNEVALHDAGELLRLDRLVQLKADGQWWVLDYKSARAPWRDPALLAQLQRYGAAVRRAQAGQVVRCALLSADGRLFEVGRE